ncbi:hypothetical protein PVA45_02650 [Entomospira entomophila]|uniref:Outer membrane lipoprotein BamD-like domain-containing protein n=1 Tax=Entomospira entomophila TaxID=2719988 RepID=A0A968G8B6_9SPIO|nr:hypothetical protein [Entomospira entomophilus]NIZ40413.1 hypothetical protein [Entomospira entomophilus]WDI35971.1 hypothetical protein PVA45_02650 [Entomospira entomophilus]
MRLRVIGLLGGIFVLLGGIAWNLQLQADNERGAYNSPQEENSPVFAYSRRIRSPASSDYIESTMESESALRLTEAVTSDFPSSKPTESKSAPVASKPAESKSTPVASKPTESKSTPVASKPTESKSTPVASKPAENKSTPVASKPTESKSTPVASKPTENKSTPVASKPTESKSAPVASKPTESKSAPVASKPTESKSAPVASKPTESKSTPVASKPTESKSTPVASKPTESKSAPVASKPAESKSTPVASKPTESKSTPVASKPTESKSAPVASKPAENKSTPVASKPTESKSTPVRVSTPTTPSSKDNDSKDVSVHPSKVGVVPVVRVPTVSAQTGVVFHVDIAERGWVLITNVTGRLQILERLLLDNNMTRYTLRAIESGEYSLEFSRQLPTSYEKKEVKLVITPYQLTSKEESQPLSDVDRAIERAMTLEEMIRESSSAREIQAITNQIHDARDTLSKTDLKKAFDLVWQERVYQLLATELGETFVTRFKADPVSAEVLYRLGQIYEAQGEDRDLRRSYNYYRRVFEQYPITQYSRLSKERMDHLDRFFFYIQ